MGYNIDYHINKRKIKKYSEEEIRTAIMRLPDNNRRHILLKELFGGTKMKTTKEIREYKLAYENRQEIIGIYEKLIKLVDVISNMKKANEICDDISVNEEPVHDFMWAIKQMKQGKKVRRKEFRDDTKYIYLKEPDLNADCGYPYKLVLWDIDAVDWEVWEEPKKEKKSLSNNIFETEVEHDCEFVKVEVLSVCYIKDFIKIIKKKIRGEGSNAYRSCEIVDEEAGEKLR